MVPGGGGCAGTGRCCLGGNKGGEDDGKDSEELRLDPGELRRGGGRGGVSAPPAPPDADGVVEPPGPGDARGGGRATVSPLTPDTE